MSFCGTKADARAIISDIQLDSGSQGNATSPIKSGSSTPGGAAMKAKPASETQIVGRLRHGIKTPKTRTDSLTRKYASTGSN